MMKLQVTKNIYTSEDRMPEASPDIIFSEDVDYADLSPSLQAKYIKQKLAQGIRKNFGSLNDRSKSFAEQKATESRKRNNVFISGSLQNKGGRI